MLQSFIIKKNVQRNNSDKIKNAHTVQFLERPEKENLDFPEQWWIEKQKQK